MSGIYIKGMEMPETCYECPCGDNEFYECMATKDRYSYHRDEYGYPDGERQDFCPLISVPDHGRLIDADSFERKVMFGDEEDLQDVIYSLRDYPAVIPADKDREE